MNVAFTTFLHFEGGATGSFFETKDRIRWYIPSESKPYLACNKLGEPWEIIRSGTPIRQTLQFWMFFWFWLICWWIWYVQQQDLREIYISVVFRARTVRKNAIRNWIALRKKYVARD